MPDSGWCTVLPCFYYHLTSSSHSHLSFLRSLLPEPRLVLRRLFTTNGHCPGGKAWQPPTAVGPQPNSLATTQAHRSGM